MKIINDDMQLILQDDNGRTLKSFLHFGAYEKERSKVFGDKKELEFKEQDFDKFIEENILK